MQFTHPPAALRPPAGAVDELLRQDQARPDHQPLHQRRRTPCARSTSGACTIVANVADDVRGRRHAGRRPTCGCSCPSRGWAVLLFFVNRVYLKQGRRHVADGPRGVDARLAPTWPRTSPACAWSPPSTARRPTSASSTASRRPTPTTTSHVARINGVYQPLLDLIGFVGQGRSSSAYGGYLIVAGKFPADGAASGRGRGGLPVLGLVHEPDPQLRELLQPADAGDGRRRARLHPAGHASRTCRTCPDAKPLPRIVGRVEFEHVTFGYNPDRPVLHDVNFERRAGPDGRAGRRDRQRQEQHHLADRPLLSAAAGPGAGGRPRHPPRHRRHRCTGRWAWCCR